MFSQEAVHVSLIKVTPTSGKGALGTWCFHFQRGGRTQSCEQTIRSRGVCEPALDIAANGKAHGRDAKASNRTWEIRPSGIIGGPRRTWPWRNCESISHTERARVVALW